MSSESRTRKWIGISTSLLPILFLTFDGVIKIIRIQPVVQSFAELGYPIELALGIGFLQLACVMLLAFPRTAVMGAVLLTGFLGGAISAQLRISAPMFSHSLFPLYVAIPMWIGLFLRENRLLVLLPFRREVMR